MSNDDLERQMRNLSRRVDQLENENQQLKQQAKISKHSYTRQSYEYKSEANIFGLPLVHIAQGINPETGKKNIAKGIIAIGDVAIGIFSIGGLAFGGFSLGGMSIGLFSLGGISLALLASFGGLAMSTGIAVGGCAIGYYAIGGSAIGYYVNGGLQIGPYSVPVVEMIEKIFFWK